MFLSEYVSRDDVDAPQLFTYTSSCGPLRALLPPWNDNLSKGTYFADIAGSGTSIDREQAALCARAEALERYCSSVYTSDQFITAAEVDLSEPCLSLLTLPVCSARELSRPGCPLTKPDPTQPIRWVRGVDLHTTEPTWVPAILSYLYFSCENEFENIAHSISTGTAAHTSYARGLLGATMEVIERDAISILWLQKMALPEIVGFLQYPRLAPYAEKFRQSSRGFEVRLFDATFDLGVPVVYGVLRSHYNKLQHTLVTCSAAATPEEAAEKAIRDMTAMRLASRGHLSPNRSPDDFRTVMDGMVYMAEASQQEGFDFLLNGTRKIGLDEMSKLSSPTPEGQMRELLGRLAEKKMRAFAVDLTTDEASTVGLKVVKVVIPGLQPLAFDARARYLGHSRLYELPRQLGYAVHDEEQLNTAPQPFG
jgi:ribosomal protein S12 methylthiotransferase accessory factor